VINITTRTTIVSSVQLDDNIRIWLLKEEGFKSAPKTSKCRRRNNFNRSQKHWMPDCRLELAEWSARRPCYSVEWSVVPWCCAVQNLTELTDEVLSTISWNFLSSSETCTWILMTTHLQCPSVTVRYLSLFTTFKGWGHMPFLNIWLCCLSSG